MEKKLSMIEFSNETNKKKYVKVEFLQVIWLLIFSRQPINSRCNFLLHESLNKVYFLSTHLFIVSQ